MTEDIFSGRAETDPNKFPKPIANTTPILCDSREPPELIKKLMAIVPVKVVQLEDGDYIIGDWYVSRKTLPDFLQSQNSGHLSDELSRLIERYEKSALIIEWDINKHEVPKEEINRLYKSAQTLHFIIPIIYTTNMDDTVDKLVYYRQKIIKGELGMMKRKPVIIGNVNPIISLYASLPGVGGDIAERIYSKYKKPWDFFNAVFYTALYDKKRWNTIAQWKSERWSAGILGVGEEKFERINSFLIDGEVIE